MPGLVVPGQQNRHLDRLFRLHIEDRCNVEKHSGAMSGGLDEPGAVSGAADILRGAAVPIGPCATALGENATAVPRGEGRAEDSGRVKGAVAYAKGKFAVLVALERPGQDDNLVLFKLVDGYGAAAKLSDAVRVLVVDDELQLLCVAVVDKEAESGLFSETFDSPIRVLIVVDGWGPLLVGTAVEGRGSRVGTC